MSDTTAAAPRPRKTPEMENLDRTRRIETRLTRLCIALGVDTPSQQAVFDPGQRTGPALELRPATLTLPSPSCSIREILAAVPEEFVGQVEVFVGKEYITTMDCRDRS